MLVVSHTGGGRARELLVRAIFDFTQYFHNLLKIIGFIPKIIYS